MPRGKMPRGKIPAGEKFSDLQLAPFWESDIFGVIFVQWRFFTVLPFYFLICFFAPFPAAPDHPLATFSEILRIFWGYP